MKKLDKPKVSVIWFRRDLRLSDHLALYYAHKAGLPVLGVFIFDEAIIKDLAVGDARLHFIYERLNKMQHEIMQHGSSLWVERGEVWEVFEKIYMQFDVQVLFANEDHEQYGIRRDADIKAWAKQKSIEFRTFHDHMVLWPGIVLKNDGLPYTVYTPFMKRWREVLNAKSLYDYTLKKDEFRWANSDDTIRFPSMDQLGMQAGRIEFPSEQADLGIISEYDKNRDFPALEGTSRLGVHLRFGTISIRKLMKEALELNAVFANELIWREFFMHILWFYPHVEQGAFRKAYDFLEWDNNEKLFERWCEGNTGISLVDAGMRQLNATGFMHNRLRMVTASFLTKNLLIDWRWGERYFAEKLLDFELSSNNGGWQWSAGTGCDAAPYFRIFNPMAQAQKFDPQGEFVKRWVPEAGTSSYPKPIVNLDLSRKKCMEVYGKIKQK